MLEGGREGGDRRRKKKGIKHKKSILKEAGVLFFFNSHPKTCAACVSEGGRGLPWLLKALPSQAPFKLHNLQQMQILCLAPLLHFSLHQLQQQCQWLSPALWQGFPSCPSPGTQAPPLPPQPPGSTLSGAAQGAAPVSGWHLCTAPNERGTEGHAGSGCSLDLSFPP